jgi:hypothetical protein
MNESVLHHVWQHRLFHHSELKTVGGEPIEIIDVGKKNTDAGPDFFNAKIKIGNTLWAGNIEIHLNSSDWFKHRHQEDVAYDNVILHVVKKADVEVICKNGLAIPQLELNFPERVVSEMNNFLQTDREFPCIDRISDIHQVFLSDWKSALIHERMRHKFAEVRMEKDVIFDQDEICYRFLCRAFGTSVNATAFEQLAMSIPWKLIQKTRFDFFILEALFFGQSGLLEAIQNRDESEQKMYNEYLFLKRKYSLKSLPHVIWKFARTRPGNFPWIRISQLVFMLYSVESLTGMINQCKEINQLKDFFSDLKAGKCWVKKCIQGNQEVSGKPGCDFSESLIINAVVPYLFAVGSYQGDEELINKAVNWLTLLKAEENKIVRNWRQKGVIFQSAFDSQSFIQLTKKYCTDKKCLRCRIGHQVLKKIVSYENEHI